MNKNTKIKNKKNKKTMKKYSYSKKILIIIFSTYKNPNKKKITHHKQSLPRIVKEAKTKKIKTTSIIIIFTKTKEKKTQMGNNIFTITTITETIIQITKTTKNGINKNKNTKKKSNTNKKKINEQKTHNLIIFFCFVFKTLYLSKSFKNFNYIYHTHIYIVK